MRIKPLYNLKQAILNLWKNPTNTLGSILIMSFTFAILGIVFIIVMNVNALVKETQSTFDKIAIFLQDEIKYSEIQEMYEELKSIDGVKNVRYEDKEVGFKRWKEEEWAEDAYLLEGIGDSPLPNAFYITLEDISYTEDVAGIINTFNGIEGIRYYREEIETMLVFSRVVAQVGLGVIAVLLVLCFFVLSNTIKIAVNSRHLEINIMKFVGAKNGFIRGPFIVEGMLIGLFSAIFSSAIVYFLYRYIVWSFGFDRLTMIDGSVVFSVIEPSQLMNSFVFIVAVLGIGIGMLGSISSTRKHLKV